MGVKPRPIQEFKEEKKMNVYGVRWKEVDKGDRIVIKERFFPSERSREEFVKRLMEKESFVETVAWSDPES